MREKLYASLDKGSLLIASPDMVQGVLHRSVILLCDHSASGAFGLMLNKTLGFEFSGDLLSFDSVESPHNIRCCMGGSLQANQMMLLHSCPNIPEQTIQICPSVFLGGDMGFLQEAMAGESDPYLTLCFGYTGWQPGQLEREFLDGMWHVAPGSYEYVFATPPDSLWSVVLRDLGGKYASLSTVPENLLLN